MPTKVALNLTQLVCMQPITSGQNVLRSFGQWHAVFLEENSLFQSDMEPGMGIV